MSETKFEEGSKGSVPDSKLLESARIDHDKIAAAGDTVQERLEKLAQVVAQREGCRLYDVEFFNGPMGRVLRVSIDHLERNVGIEDCSNVSKGLNLLLDVDDLIPESSYYLEVSSPGLERQLKKDWHFQVAVGKAAKVKTRRALGDLGVQAAKWKALRQFKEVIKACDEKGVSFDLEGEDFTLPFGEIEKAQLVFDYGMNQNPQAKVKPSHAKGKQKKKSKK